MVDSDESNGKDCDPNEDDAAPHPSQGLDCLQHLTRQGCLGQDPQPSSGPARFALSP